MDISANEAKTKEYRLKAEAIVRQMTLEEKVPQTLHTAPAVERLGIKAYNWWNEALHGVARAGVATVFPQAIGLAASFDENMLEEVGDAVSTEGRGKFNMQQAYDDTDIYKGLTFWAPNVNIFRDPRWGRGHETYGEDPFLTSRLGVRYINGIQGHDENYLKAAACAKHFAVHSGPESVRHEFNAIATKQDMYETYLPAFKAAVTEAHVETVMGAYNRTNGEPCCGSKTLLKDILRDEWGFKGHVTSDCWAIKDFHEGHHVTKDPVESVALAMNNGCDLNCGNIFVYLKDAVKEGLVKEERIDEALTNLYTTRMKLGVFDKKEDNKFDKIGYDVVDSKEMRDLNLKVSEKTIVLLKNENRLLPLKKSALKTIGVVGPNANSRAALVGNYEGTSSRYVTVLEGIQDYVGDDVRVMYSEGCHLYKDKTNNLANGVERFAEVKEICRVSDVVMVCVGLDATLEGEEGDTGNEYGSGDKPNLKLPGRQEELVKLCVENAKKVIVVNLSGSAMDLSYAEENAAAVVQAWYPGAQGGHALANILFGEKSPEGRLPVTFYRSTEDLPEFTDYSMKERTYRYMTKDALYPFGYGLSYSNFVYTDAAGDKGEITKDGMTVSVNVKNNGAFDAGEAVEVYVKAIPSDEASNVPNFQLKGLKKVAFRAGEAKTVSIKLPVESFGLYNEEGKCIVHKGEYVVYVGGQAPDTRSARLTGKKPLELSFKCAESFEI